VPKLMVANIMGFTVRVPVYIVS